ncbi:MULTISPECIES: ROK family protein [Saccharothrix]|uniref:ROK family protein n=1 Tax=Saccharothrix TaxID=2071 RepID=UPI00093C151E|nr:ROK family protein [Saccharothrix sp. CB00851]OKI17527.1 kanamycin kinase [Saccharothrix sp. CB00851]
MSVATAAYLGIDIGGTKVAARVEDDRETVGEWVFAWQPDGTVDHDLRLLREHVTALRCRIGPLAGVGVAVPATLDRDGRVTAWPTRPSWVGLDLRALLADLFPATTPRWADDGDLAAVAEARAWGHADLVYAGVGTGVGGGIVLGGRSATGHRGSCEIGHLVVDLDGVRCDCGRLGCVQAVASGPAILRRARALRGTGVTPTELVDGFVAQEDWAVEAVRRGSAALAAALAGVAELVRPSAIVIGGGFAAALPGYVDLVASAAAALGRRGHPVPPVLPARLGGASSLHGAVLAARGRS